MSERKPIAKSRRPQAERAAEHWLHEIAGCVKSRRVSHSRFHEVDFFAADVVGKTSSGCHVYAQATAGSYAAVSARRRKLEKIPWHETDLVYVLQLVEQQDPANRRRKQWWFRVHEYESPPQVAESAFRRWWTWETATPVPSEWFKARKETSCNPAP